MLTKKIIEILVKTIIWVIVIFLIIGLTINYFARLQWKIRKGENYCKNNQYSIWKAYNDNLLYFCDNNIKWRCLGNIKSLFIDQNKNLYLNFEIWNFVWKTDNEIRDILSKIINPRGYVYSIFMNDLNFSYSAKSYEEIIKFLKLDSECNLKFYSEKDMKNLPKEEKDIFLNLLNKKRN